VISTTIATHVVIHNVPLLDFDLRDERAITERLRNLAAIPAGSPIIRGIGDDCAIYRPRGSTDDLLFTSDMFVEGVHFLRETHRAALAGRKALVRSLSDIAAMGGTPRFCLVSLCIPGLASAKWVDRFFDGILDLAAKTGAVLAGGDLSHGETLACDVTVCGAVPRGTALRRDGARPGHEIYVSGVLGGSALGLETKKSKARLDSNQRKALRRHLRPEPRLALGNFLRERLRASSAIDLSDGLSLDLRRLCLASGVEAEIVAPPQFPGASRSQALHGGEEYELLFTVPTGTKVPGRFEGLPLTRLGSILRGSAGEVRLDGKPLKALGYDHFAPGRTPAAGPKPRPTK
jgi:thiamine-monophosphate kinase